MLEQKFNLANLFTFGEGQMQQCISQQRKQKFPFLNQIKMKKNPVSHQVFSQQRQKMENQGENNNNINFEDRRVDRRRTISKVLKKAVIQADDLINKNGSTKKAGFNAKENKQKKKASMPKELKNIFPKIDADLKRRKITSADPSNRYREQQDISIDLIQPFSLHNESRQVRAKSVMYLSEEINEKCIQKIQTIQGRSRMDWRNYKGKCEKMGKINISSKIRENINQLKKLYC